MELFSNITYRELIENYRPISQYYNTENINKRLVAFQKHMAKGFEDDSSYNILNSDIYNNDLILFEDLIFPQYYKSYGNEQDNQMMFDAYVKRAENKYKKSDTVVVREEKQERNEILNLDEDNIYGKYIDSRWAFCFTNAVYELLKIRKLVLFESKTTDEVLVKVTTTNGNTYLFDINLIPPMRDVLQRANPSKKEYTFESTQEEVNPYHARRTMGDVGNRDYYNLFEDIREPIEYTEVMREIFKCEVLNAIELGRLKSCLMVDEEPVSSLRQGLQRLKPEINEMINIISNVSGQRVYYMNFNVEIPFKADGQVTEKHTAHKYAKFSHDTSDGLGVPIIDILNNVDDLTPLVNKSKFEINARRNKRNINSTLININNNLRSTYKLNTKLKFKFSKNTELLENDFNLNITKEKYNINAENDSGTLYILNIEGNTDLDTSYSNEIVKIIKSIGTIFSNYQSNIKKELSSLLVETFMVKVTENKDTFTSLIDMKLYDSDNKFILVDNINKNYKEILNDYKEYKSSVKKLEKATENTIDKLLLSNSYGYIEITDENTNEDGRLVYELSYSDIYTDEIGIHEIISKKKVK